MPNDLRERVVGLLIREYAARTQCTMTDGEQAEWDADADAILALVRDHLTGDEAVARACDSLDLQHEYWIDQLRVAVLAALGGEGG